MLLENQFSVNNSRSASARSVSETSLYKAPITNNVFNNNHFSQNPYDLRSTSQWDVQQKTSDLLLDASRSLISHSPELCPEGTGGTYFLKNSQNDTIAVFKPREEDPLSRLNPKRKEFDAPFHLKGILPGEGILREVLAYQLAPNLFHVPETHIIDVSHKAFYDPSKSSSSLKRRRGSLQKFIHGTVTAEDVGSSLFSVQDVQSIALLDIIMVNCDRNAGNILVKEDSYQLIPIDHSFSLPDIYNLLDLQWFEWMNYRQSKQPLLDHLQEFVKNININSWIEKAVALRIRHECIMTMKLSFTFLVKALSFGKTLFEIGKLMCTPNIKNPSVFSCLVEQARAEAIHSGKLHHHFAILVSDYFSSTF